MMQKTRLILLTIAVVTGLAACQEAPVLKKVTIPEAASLVASNTGNLQIVDLRTPGEIAATGALPAAAFMDYMAPGFPAKMEQLDKKRPVLLYCASGARSAAAAAVLHQQGFQTVYDMSEGMNGWLGRGNKTELVR